MRTETVDYKAIAPNPNNPRQEFNEPALKAMAESFAFTPERPGEPFQPPIVVRDGERYLIIDGERRWRAMGMLGTERCTVNVAEDMDEANAVAAALATDSKEKLTSAERAVGMQQMLLLGASDEAAETLAGASAGSAAAARKVALQAGHAVQVSMDDLFKVAAIDDESGREELIRILEEDGMEAGWGSRFHTRQRELSALQRAANDRREAQHLLADLVDARELDDVVEGEEPDQMAWSLNMRLTMSQLRTAAGGEGLGLDRGDAIGYLPPLPDKADSWGGVPQLYIGVYIPVSAEEAAERDAETAAEEDRRATRAMLEEQVSEFTDAHLAFAVGICASGEIGLEAYEVLHDAIREAAWDKGSETVWDAMDAAGAAFGTATQLLAVLPFTWLQSVDFSLHRYGRAASRYSMEGEEVPSYYVDDIREMVGVYDMLMECDYEPSNDERRVFEGWRTNMPDE